MRSGRQRTQSEKRAEGRVLGNCFPNPGERGGVEEKAQPDMQEERQESESEAKGKVFQGGSTVSKAEQSR